MSRSFADVADEALRLPPREQLRLARALLENSEASGGIEVEAMWEAEIERRIRKIDAGVAKGRPVADVLREADKRLGK